MKDGIPTFLQKKLNDLIELMLTDGVQPSELADNIFLPTYKSVAYQKINEQVIGELTFLEEINSVNTTVRLRYYYSEEKKVTKIEEELHEKVNVIWCRDNTEDRIIQEIYELMTVMYDKEQVVKFINTLPEDLKHKLIKNQSITA
ncbi:hypothetical protein M5X11_32425 [Paenibacillus alginolyticus]|uniref:hypothetical protein n=1 Tax=Paenibacillus alginolyticus TaxID=59839 RepID=UPI000413DC2D|nr:hypothetical protein [Paenibacillus alginolyticus]MCY9669575.1 hypothetical protein [Paenibacillus alginolyticus]